MLNLSEKVINFFAYVDETEAKKKKEAEVKLYHEFRDTLCEGASRSMRDLFPVLLAKLENEEHKYIVFLGPKGLIKDVEGSIVTASKRHFIKDEFRSNFWARDEFLNDYPGFYNFATKHQIQMLDYRDLDGYWDSLNAEDQKLLVSSILKRSR